MLARCLGFEPRKELPLLVFKTSALNQTLPTPRMIGITPCFTSFLHTPLTSSNFYSNYDYF